jgi:hypothetical protein
MSEAKHKAALCKALRAGLPVGDGKVIRHEDAFTGGIPDISISFHRRTLWIEVKLDRPGRRSKVTELQLKALRELCGFLLTFEEHQNGTITARMLDSFGLPYWSTQPYTTKTRLYQDVATRLLREVGV